MSGSTKKHGILVAVDGSPESDAAVSWAAHQVEMRDVHGVGHCASRPISTLTIGWRDDIAASASFTESASGRLVSIRWPSVEPSACSANSAAI